MANSSFDDLKVGMVSKRVYRFTPQQVEAFATLVEDHAPVHTDFEFAQRLGYSDRIVHGLFVQCIISGILGNEIPGPSSVINNVSMKMHAPVLVDQVVEYHVEIVALTNAVSAVSLQISGSVDGKLVISGKALCSFPEANTNWDE